jgi:hypothetical protein
MRKEVGMRGATAMATAALLATAALPATTRRAEAQQTPADTARVIVQVATSLETSGQRELAEEMYRLVFQRYPNTDAAREAARRLAALGNVRRQGSGRVQFVTWTTLFGTWLGVATPAAFGAETAPPYGVGLLAGGGLGFIAANTYARGRAMSSGQAGAYTFATAWASWQAMGWRAVLDIGRRQECFPDGTGGQYCYDTTPEEAPFTAAVIGGLAGIGAGIALSKTNVQSGDISLVDHAAIWGTWYGFALRTLLRRDDWVGDEDDDVLTFLLLGGNAFALAAIPAARAWQPTGGQVRLTSIAGLAGGVAGLGIDLIMQTEDDDVAILVPTLGVTAGLLAGAISTRLTTGERDLARAGPDAVDLALLNVRDGVRLSLPAPIPTALPAIANGRLTVRPGVRLTLLDAHF